MAIQFKRRTGSVGGPTSLLAGEIAINFDEKVFYSSSNGVDMIKLGGVGTITEVNGQTGPVVTLDTDNINEGTTNLYYTTNRFDTQFATKTTDGLTEGATNKYYSSALFDASFQGKTTTDLTEGSNLYYTEARGIATFDAQLALSNTDALNEGTTNLYYTDARVQSYVAGTMINDTTASSTTLYSSSKIDAIVAGSLVYKGAWDASTNTPTLSDATGIQNEYYKVSVAGTQDLGSGSVSYVVGDDVIHNGTIWEKFGSSPAPVDSVNGKIGIVVLTTDDINEGVTNLYYTSARTLSDVASAGYGIIDDVTVGGSLTTTWSSAYMTTLLGDAIEVDDNVDNTSTTKTWSTSKLTATFMPIDVDYGTY